MPIGFRSSPWDKSSEAIRRLLGTGSVHVRSRRDRPLRLAVARRPPIRRLPMCYWADTSTTTEVPTKERPSRAGTELSSPPRRTATRPRRSLVAGSQQFSPVQPAYFKLRTRAVAYLNRNRDGSQAFFRNSFALDPGEDVIWSGAQEETPTSPSMESACPCFKSTTPDWLKITHTPATPGQDLSRSWKPTRNSTRTGDFAGRSHPTARSRGPGRDTGRGVVATASECG